MRYLQEEVNRNGDRLTVRYLQEEVNREWWWTDSEVPTGGSKQGMVMD